MPRRIVQIDPAGGGATQSGGDFNPSLIMHVQFGMAGMAFAHGYAVSKSSRRVCFLGRCSIWWFECNARLGAKYER